mmetsp:Transcript_18995/g.29671  ORF Transcript_18995/g.29671 Transcript_18995/m.29671 type:complete len:265 (-) Transcript_18995:723-1517(-)
MMHYAGRPRRSPSPLISWPRRQFLTCLQHPRARITDGRSYHEYGALGPQLLPRHKNCNRQSALRSDPDMVLPFPQILEIIDKPLSDDPIWLVFFLDHDRRIVSYGQSILSRTPSFTSRSFRLVFDNSIMPLPHMYPTNLYPGVSNNLEPHLCLVLPAELNCSGPAVVLSVRITGQPFLRPTLFLKSVVHYPDVPKSWSFFVLSPVNNRGIPPCIPLRLSPHLHFLLHLWDPIWWPLYSLRLGLISCLDLNSLVLQVASLVPCRR